MITEKYKNDLNLVVNSKFPIRLKMFQTTLAKTLLLGMLAMFILLLVTADVSLTNNVDVYKNENKTAVFSKVDAEATLVSHTKVNKPKYVIHGKNREVLRYEIKNMGDNFKEGIGKFEITNMKTGKSEDKDYYFQYAVYGWDTKQFTEESCKWIIDAKHINGTYYNCSYTTKEELVWKIINWKNITSYDISKGNVTIRILTDVEQGDYMDGVLTLFDEKLEKHATWVSSMDIDLLVYYNFSDKRESVELNGNLSYNLTVYPGQGDTVDVIYQSNGINGTFANFTYDTAGATSPVLNDGLNITIPRGGYTGYRAPNRSMCFFFRLAGDNDGKIGHILGSADGDINCVDNDVIDIDYPGNLTIEIHLIGRWIHFCYTTNDSRSMLYLDGNLHQIGDVGSFSNNMLVLGQQHDAVDPPTDGADSGAEGFVMDELGIWNRTLSATEVEQLNTTGITYIPDITAPTITADAPINATIVGNNISDTLTGITFKYTATDIAGIDTCNILGNWTTEWHINNSDNSVTSGAQETKYLPIYVDGNYSWGVECNDTLGNKGNSTIKTIMVDNTKPNMTIRSPTGATETSLTILLNITGQDLGSGFDYCYFNVTRGASLEIANNDTNLINFTEYFIVSADDTTYVLNSYCNDSVNNNNISSISFLVDVGGDGGNGGGGGGGGGGEEEEEPSTFCGDGECNRERGETFYNCPDDCAVDLSDFNLDSLFLNCLDGYIEDDQAKLDECMWTANPGLLIIVAFIFGIFIFTIFFQFIPSPKGTKKFIRVKRKKWWKRKRR